MKLRAFMRDYLAHTEDALSLLSIRHNPSERGSCRRNWQEQALLLRMWLGKCKIGFVSFLIGEK